jgi:dethiobiotin synthetase
LIALLQERFPQVAAWVPVDVNDMGYQRDDLDSDAERLRVATGMTEHISLANPYLLNEDLPPELAARRDGIAIDSTLLHGRLQLLRQRADIVLMECLPEVHLRWNSAQTGLDFLREWQPNVLWVAQIGRDALEPTLLSVRSLQQAGLSVTVLLNNLHNQRSADLLHYQWLTLEEQLEVRVLGLLPYQPLAEERQAAWLRDHLEAHFLDALVVAPAA